MSIDYIFKLWVKDVIMSIASLTDEDIQLNSFSFELKIQRKKEGYNSKFS